MKKYIVIALALATVSVVQSADCYHDDETIQCGQINKSGPDIYLDCNLDGIKETLRYSKWTQNTYYTPARNANNGETGVTTTTGDSRCSGNIVYMGCDNKVVNTYYQGLTPYVKIVNGTPPSICVGTGG